MAFAKLIEIPTYGLLLISKINIANLKMVTPDLYQVILYYLISFISRNLYLIFHLKNCNETQKRIKNIIYLVKYKLRPYFRKIVGVVIVVLLVRIIITKIPHDLEIHFIDVGQGDSTLIITPNDKTILIDGGQNTLIPYLLDRKIKKLNYIFISHFDDDHVGRSFKYIKRVKG